MNPIQADIDFHNGYISFSESIFYEGEYILKYSYFPWMRLFITTSYN